MTDISNRDTNMPEVKNENAEDAVLIVTGNQVEDLEFFYPYYRFLEAGFRVDVATPEGGLFKAKHGISLSDSIRLDDVSSDSYRLLYLPGGKAPEKLKQITEAVEIVRDFAESGKPIAALCHGPQLLAAADVIKGKKIAAWPEVEDEIRRAGADYVNAETVIDGQFITARWPGDLPMHLKFTLQTLYATRSKQKSAAA